MSIKLLIIIILIVILVFFILPVLVMGGVLYFVLLVRTGKEKWGRSCSIPDDEEYVKMFEEGLGWNEIWKDKKQQVSIKSCGLELVGEYFDFGEDKAVIIVPGRMESLLYSYYFAEPYRKSGCNVLVIDNRAHGLSDGKIASLGFREYKDLIAWARMLDERFGIKKVILHGICIGSSASLFALTSPKCPDNLCAMVADGMYTTFCESFKNHMVELNKPNFPLTPSVMLWIRVVSGANVVTDGPIKRIKKLTKPILFVHSKEDEYSLPEKVKVLYERCGAPKEIVWFDKGAHSRIRPNCMEKYDCAIEKFVRKL